MWFIFAPTQSEASHLSFDPPCTYLGSTPTQMCTESTAGTIGSTLNTLLAMALSPQTKPARGHGIHA